MKKLLIIKILLILFYLTMNLYAMSSSQVSEINLKLISIDGIKTSYSTDDLVKFEVNNRSDDTILFYCAVEKKIEDQWREVVLSIDSIPINKTVKLTKLVPFVPHLLSWRRTESKHYPVINTGIFRFKLEIFENKEKKNIGKLFSNEFTIFNQGFKNKKE